MNIDGMKLFCAVYESRGIAKAGNLLYLSHQAVSKRIKALETELGTPLFSRSAQGLEPTEGGEEAYRSFRRILDEYRTLESRMCTLRQKPVKMRIVIEYYDIESLDIDALFQFGDDFFDSSLDFDFCANEECYARLLEGRADLAITNRPLASPEKFGFNTLRICPTCVGFSETSPLARKESVTLKDFEGWTFLSILGGGATNRAILDLFDDEGVDVASRSFSYDFATLIKLLRNGQGFHVFPEDFGNRLTADSGIVVKPISLAKPIFELCLVWEKARYQDRRLQDLIEFLMDNTCGILAKTA